MYDIYKNIEEYNPNKKRKILIVFDDMIADMLRNKKLFFFYLDFLSRPFTNHRTAGEWGGHFFNSSLPLPLASQTLRH